MTETAYALYVGIDWGTAAHQVAVLDTQRAPLGERAVAHDGAALQTFTEWLTLLAAGEPARVAVALEVPRGAVVDTLLERGFHVFALNPKQLDRFRDRYTVAGAKDDRRDAFVLTSRTKGSVAGSTTCRPPSSSTRPGSIRISSTLFTHALTHEVTYGGLLQERRRELHARIVGAIETLHRDRLGEQIERLAHHALRGDLREKAVGYLRQAGLKAAARSALQDARAWFEQALGVLDALPESLFTLGQAFEIRLESRTALIQLGEVQGRGADEKCARLTEGLKRWPE